MHGAKGAKLSKSMAGVCGGYAEKELEAKASLYKKTPSSEDAPERVSLGPTRGALPGRKCSILESSVPFCILTNSIEATGRGDKKSVSDG